MNRDFLIGKTEEILCDFDVVIVGSGAAGLNAALNVDGNLRCALINKYSVKESNSIYAQGGMASVILPDDSVEKHIGDTLKAGAGLCNREAVEILVSEGRSEIQSLIKIGMPFDTENGHLSISREAAHSSNRILHSGGDATGYHLVMTLLKEVRKRENIKILDNLMLCDIILNENGSVWGIGVKDKNFKDLLIKSPSVILATGGIGQVYRNTTNSLCCTGDGIAAAARAGAETENMEFVQFHPTALIHPDLNMRFFLISEALRGEGAVLLNRKGERFMLNVHPLAELAPRDIVSRAIVYEMRKHDLPCVYLDISFKGREYLSKRFPVIYEECMKRGIDIAFNWIPVIPVQHYFMGGIKTNVWGETDIEGLYACGECSCTGVHGANRLASNSLIECLVFGRRCALRASERKAKAGKPQLPQGDKPICEHDFQTYRSRIKHIMTKQGGIIRNKRGLVEAQEEIGAYKNTLFNCRLKTVAEAETLNMAEIALMVIDAALKREKSIGAHYRED
jgi:L-aspartate oxidase